MTKFGPYELLRRLGSGATAEVHLATPLRGKGELVALKIILPHLAQEDRVRRNLVRELEMTALLRHPNVVEVFEVSEAEGRAYLAMEFVRGWPLSLLVRKLKEGSKAITFLEACALAREAALGLEHAHEAKGRDGKPLGLVHRDVTPQNLLVCEDGHLKVVDFGLVKATLASPTNTGAMKGKLAYMPPEQIRGGAIDRRADVFALGAVLWELLCGERLYPGKTEAEILQQALNRPVPRADRVVPGLPRELADALAQALERDLPRRLPSCGVLADILEPFTKEETPKRLAARVAGLFDPIPRDADEARAAAQPRARPAKPAAPAPAVDDVTIPNAPLPRVASRQPEQAKARRSGLKPAAQERPAQRAERPADAEADRPVDREVLLHPLLASRPERFRPKIGDKPQLTDHRIGYGPEELSVSKLIPRHSPTRRLGVVVAGVFAAAALLLLGVYAYTRVTPPQRLEATRPPAPEEPGEAADPDRAAKPKPTRGTLIVQSDVPAFVRQGERELGMTPATLTLPAGANRLTVRAVDGSGSVDLVVQVPAGGEVVQKVSLAP